MKFIKGLSLFAATMLLVGSAFGQLSVNATGPQWGLATNIAAFPKAATANYYDVTNTISTPVPMPPSAGTRGLQIQLMAVPAGALVGTSNLTVYFNLSDGVNPYTTTLPVSASLTFAQLSNVVAWTYIAPTNLYGVAFIRPDRVTTAALTNGTLSIGYSWVAP